MRYCVLLFVCCFAHVALAAAPPDAIARIEKLLPESSPKAIQVSQWTVERAIENPFVGSPEKSDAPRKINAASAFQFAGHVVVEDASNGHWLEGQSPEPGKLRYSREFDSFQEFLDGNAFAPLPEPPAGFELRQLAVMPKSPVRLVADRDGKFLYVLCDDGTVYCIDLTTDQMQKVIEPSQYGKDSDGSFMGITIDRDGRMYMVGNHADGNQKPMQNVVTVYRTAPVQNHRPEEPKPWLRISIPFGIHTFNHGVSHIAQGPDGMIYVSSGSRTDHGEAGNEPNKSTEGEDPHTSCIWRLDPKAENPKLEVFARGLRNPFGFCWNDKGELFATENGPNADPPEELNRVEAGKHYGFPFKFSDWPKKAYPDEPDAPANFQYEFPIMNIGPNAGGSPEHPLGTFDPHSSPAGIVFLGNDFPESHRGHFLVARFGNLIDLPKDVGFDLLEVTLKPTTNGPMQAEVRTFLSPIARPTGLCLAPGGRVFICEHSREVKHAHDMLPGRILELRVKKNVLKPEGSGGGGDGGTR
jgi:glucose/arabinose dehydrogenase